MASSSGDPRLLYAIPNIEAYHIQDGQEQSLTPSGGQTLSLLMVPVDSHVADKAASTASMSVNLDEDFTFTYIFPQSLTYRCLPQRTSSINHRTPI